MGKIIFDRESPIDYVKKGWKHNTRFKAVLHTKDGQIKPYFTLGKLQRENPRFKNLTRAYVNIGDYDTEIWISQIDAKKLRTINYFSDINKEMLDDYLRMESDGIDMGDNGEVMDNADMQFSDKQINYIRTNYDKLMEKYYG